MQSKVVYMTIHPIPYECVSILKLTQQWPILTRELFSLIIQDHVSYHTWVCSIFFHNFNFINFHVFQPFSYTFNLSKTLHSFHYHAYALLNQNQHPLIMNHTQTYSIANFHFFIGKCESLIKLHTNLYSHSRITIASLYIYINLNTTEYVFLVPCMYT